MLNYQPEVRLSLGVPNNDDDGDDDDVDDDSDNDDNNDDDDDDDDDREHRRHRLCRQEVEVWTANFLSFWSIVQS